MDAEGLQHRFRVLVIDDKAMPRIAVRAILSHSASFQLTGEASSGSDGVRLVRESRPDVVLLDVDMPGMDGAATARAIFELEPPHPKVLAWTVSEQSEDVIRMIRAGCVGFILKDAGPEELVRAIEAGLRGDTPVPRKLIPEIIARAVAAPQQTDPSAPSLSVRELEVLRGLVKGRSNKDMARDLGISKRSVDTHLSNLYRKLDVSSRGQAVHEAVQLGLIGPEDL